MYSSKVRRNVKDKMLLEPSNCRVFEVNAFNKALNVQVISCLSCGRVLGSPRFHLVWHFLHGWWIWGESSLWIFLGSNMPLGLIGSLCGRRVGAFAQPFCVC